MIDLELELATQETQWRDADDLAKAARAELVATANDSVALLAVLRKRIDRAERMKQTIMKKILSLEEHLDSDSPA